MNTQLIPSDDATWSSKRQSKPIEVYAEVDFGQSQGAKTKAELDNIRSSYNESFQITMMEERLKIQL